MPNSILDAIKLGIWDFEPDNGERTEFDATAALPGSNEKLEVLSQRVRDGKPLWHPNDRRTYDDSEAIPQ